MKAVKRFAKLHSDSAGRRSGHTKVRAPTIPLTTPGRYRTGHILAVTGWSHSTLYARIKDGKFPAPQKDGALNFWPTSVVRDALGL